MKLQEVLKQLKKLQSFKVSETKRRFGIDPKNSYGIFIKDLKVVAKQIGNDDCLAFELFDCGIYEAKLLVPMIFNPSHLTKNIMEKWVGNFDNWEICDTFCMGFFGASQFAVEKALEWVHSSREFQKRAAFVCIVSYAFTNKEASNDEFREFFPLLIQQATDERKYVMKAINWALRQIGKRNKDLLIQAIDTANQILRLNTPSSRWIAKDALRELMSKNVSMKNYPSAIYKSRQKR